ncbi:MlaC/ttg2D family ABC transporter substrate-binding protein [Endozoicomonadaceae bacterium StTr2]
MRWIKFPGKWMSTFKTLMAAQAISLGLLVVAQAATAAEAAKGDPAVVVRETADALIANINKNRAEYEKDTDKLFQYLDTALSPKVAGESFARGVMGKYAHRTTEAKIHEFESKVKSSAMRLYGRGILKYQNEKIEVKDASKASLEDYNAGKVRSVPVEMVISTASGSSYQASFSMMSDDGEWKVRNIVVEGINIGVVFRNQFHDAMQRYGSVDKVIEYWDEIMKSSQQQTEKQIEKQHESQPAAAG